MTPNSRRVLIAGLALLVGCASRPTVLSDTLTIRGRVLASDTRKPLPSAQVIVPGTGRSALARADGLFELRMPRPPYPSVELRVLFIGYSQAQRVLRVPRDSVLEAGVIRLKARPVHVDDLVVDTAPRRPRR
jgi:hypothetical protein